MMLGRNALIYFESCVLVTSVLFGLAATNASVWMEPKDVQMELSKSASITAYFRNLTTKWPVNVTVVGDEVVQLAERSLVLPIGSGKAVIEVTAVMAGHADLVMKPDNGSRGRHQFDDAFVHISVGKHSYLSTISVVIGWLYFLAWSISYYPQTYENWRRKSVVGLNFDFLSLNTIAFACYSAYNAGLYFAPVVQQEYRELHPRGVIPIELNDVFFALHALFACLTQAFQCLMYERGSQKISRVASLLIVVIFLYSMIGLVLSGTDTMQWLAYLYGLSYTKLAITFIKYIPQAYYNYVRKSTQGWSIGNVLLDFTGGICSIVQMFVISYNFNDWDSIFGNPAKFGLGLFSICFDVFFMLQHYVFYRRPRVPYQAIQEDHHSNDQRISD